MSPGRPLCQPRQGAEGMCAEAQAGSWYQPHVPPLRGSCGSPNATPVRQPQILSTPEIYAIPSTRQAPGKGDCKGGGGFVATGHALLPSDLQPPTSTGVTAALCRWGSFWQRSGFCSLDSAPHSPWGLGQRLPLSPGLDFPVCRVELTIRSSQACRGDEVACNSGGRQPSSWLGLHKKGQKLREKLEGQKWGVAEPQDGFQGSSGAALNQND